MFTFKGSPVYIKIWFLLLFAWLSPSMVVAIFLSVLVHELAHAFAAVRLGYTVRQIYIDLFYGAAEIDLEYCPEKDSIKIIAAGPISNLLLALVSISFAAFSAQLGGWFAGTAFMAEMIYINFALFAFNLLPIYPMDGGKILRSALMMKMPKNRRLGKRISDWVSLSTSVVLFAVCVYTSSILLGIFSLLFIYFALKELNYIK